MADERPPKLAQSIVGYFDTGTSNKVLGALALCREITSYYTNSGLVSYLNIIFTLTVDWQNYRFWKAMANLSKVGYLTVCHSNTIPTGRHFWQCPVVKVHLASVLCLVSERPVFETWFFGSNLCPPRSGNWQKCLEVGVGRTNLSIFTLTWTFPSGSKLAAFELKNRHVLIMIV